MKDSRQVVLLKLDDILPNRFQPRIKFDEQAIVELSESIKEHGVIQPIIVRQISDKYEIIAGERRYKASVMAGKSVIPAIIVNLNDKDSSEIALIENVQRQDLTPIEEAISYRKILDMGYLTQEELANKLGVAQPTIANKLRLLNLDDEVQEALLDGKISERHARSLLRLSKSSMQKEMLNRIINERLTVRKTDEEINSMMKNNDTSVFDSFGKNEVASYENISGNLQTNNGDNPFIINENNSDSMQNKNVEVLDFGFEETNTPSEQTITEPINNMPQASSINNEEEATTAAINNEVQIEQPAKVTNDPTPTGPSTNRFFTMMPPTAEPAEEVSNPNTIENSEENTILNVFNNQNISPNPNVTSPIVIDSDDNNDVVIEDSEAVVDEDVPVEEIITPLDEEPILQSEPIHQEQPVSSIVTLRDVINKMRHCADEIEAMGFNIDTEEFDFDDMYQVIFKIQK